MAFTDVFCELGIEKGMSEMILLGDPSHILWGVHPIATFSQRDYLDSHEAHPAKEHQLGKRKTS